MRSAGAFVRLVRARLSAELRAGIFADRTRLSPRAVDFLRPGRPVTIAVMPSHRTAAALALALLARAAAGGDAPQTPAVESVGDRTQIMRGDLAGRVPLASLRELKHLYAVGPVAGLRGEVTVLDGTPHVSVLDADGRPRELTEDEAWRRSAIFLAYCDAPKLGEPATLGAVADLAALRPAVERAALAAGVDLDRTPFLVRVDGLAAELTYHVIWKADDAPHGKAEHQKAKAKFTRRNVPVRLVGFYSRPGEGRVTHPGNPLHVHVVLPDEAGEGEASGHVDAVRLEPGALLRLPNG